MNLLLEKWEVFKDLCFGGIWGLGCQVNAFVGERTTVSTPSLHI